MNSGPPKTYSEIEEILSSDRTQPEDQPDSNLVMSIKPDRSTEFSSESFDEDPSLEEAKEEVQAFREEYTEKVEEIMRLEARVLQYAGWGTAEEKVEEAVGETFERIGYDPDIAYDIWRFYNKIVEQREAVQFRFSRYEGDPESLYEVALGRTPKGRVEAVNGGYFLYLRCFDEEDYAWGRYQKFATGGSLSQKEVETAAVSNGVYISSAADPQLKGAIALENTARLSEAEREEFVAARSTYVHEARHAANSYLLRHEGRVFDIPVKSMLQEAAMEGDRDRVAYLFRKLMRDRRAKWYEKKAADEIMAFLVSGRDPDDVHSLLTINREFGGAYDFYGEEAYGKKGESAHSVNAFTSHFVSIVGDEYRDVVEVSLRRVFRIEYRNLIRNGVASWERLEQRGLKSHELAMLFRTIPLRRWERISKRIAENKPLDYETFQLGDSAFTLSESGELVYGFTEYDSQTGEMYILGRDGEYKDKRIKSSLTKKEAKYLNYPFKPVSEWELIWNVLGGEKGLKDKVDLDFSSDEPISALEAWNSFRSIYLEGNSDERVKEGFRIFRQYLRKKY